MPLSLSLSLMMRDNLTSHADFHFQWKRLFACSVAAFPLTVCFCCCCSQPSKACDAWQGAKAAASGPSGSASRAFVARLARLQADTVSTVCNESASESRLRERRERRETQKRVPVMKKSIYFPFSLTACVSHFPVWDCSLSKGERERQERVLSLLLSSAERERERLFIVCLLFHCFALQNDEGEGEREREGQICMSAHFIPLSPPEARPVHTDTFLFVCWQNRETESPRDQSPKSLSNDSITHLQTGTGHKLADS